MLKALRPHVGHLVGAALILCGLLFACLLPRTDGQTFVRPLAQAASNPVNTAFISVGIMIMLGLAYAARSWADFKQATWVMLTVTLLVQGIQKPSFHIFGLWPRPSGSDGGMPSGHAAASCALAYLLTLRVPRLAPLWYAIAALISWSRVESGAHYPYQVVAGAIVGLTVAVVLTRRFPRTAPAPG